MNALGWIQFGDEHPYDAPDSWLDTWPSPPPPAPTDYAHRAARGIVASLSGRNGGDHFFERLDEGLRVEITEEIASIIREAVRQTTL